MAGRWSSLLVLLTVYTCGLLASVVTISDNPIVEVRQGVLKGKFLTSVRSKNEFVGFLGVPYAKPPVGDLKFKAPEAPELWTGTRDASKEGSACAQRNDLTRLLLGEDDCLFLNVYTLKLPDGSNATLKPVMVFIHGGAFYFGSSSSRVYGPDYLIDQDVVLVTINYRLGPQGFLSLQNGEVPGNAGLKDQVMALRWVRQNIEQFGGDPENVTIFGQSAGGASVQYHMLSPMSKGLFHRAISQSGSVLNTWAFTNSSRNMAFRLGEKLGLKTDDPQELVKFLRSVDTLTLTNASHDVLTLEEKPMAFGYPFLPTIETESEGEVFLSASPRELLDLGKINAVPLIAGVTSHEGILAVNLLNELPEGLAILDKEFERALPPDLPVARNTNMSMKISNMIKKFYFGDEHVTEETKGQFINMITDIWFMKDVNTAVEKIAAQSPFPVYYYQFSFDGPLGIFKRIFGAENLPGAAHADELGYLFRMLLTSRVNLKPEDPVTITLSRMIKMWTNFARIGNPIPEEDPLLNVTWIPYTSEEHSYLNIDENLSLLHDLNEDRLQFWKDLYNSTPR